MSFIMTVLLVVIFYGILLLFKMKNTYENQKIILDAIVGYDDDYNDLSKTLELMGNMESYSSTVFRLWDWGYTRILPKEDFELIKPYIQEKRNGNKRTNH